MCHNRSGRRNQNTTESSPVACPDNEPSHTSVIGRVVPYLLVAYIKPIGILIFAVTASAIAMFRGMHHRAGIGGDIENRHVVCEHYTREREREHHKRTCVMLAYYVPIFYVASYARTVVHTTTDFSFYMVAIAAIQVNMAIADAVTANIKIPIGLIYATSRYGTTRPIVYDVLALAHVCNARILRADFLCRLLCPHGGAYYSRTGFLAWLPAQDQT
jgi:hypothetical protein